eukprot:2015203-Alexandrium_andersonii.AAC.1
MRHEGSCGSVNECSNAHDANATVSTYSTVAHAVQAIPTHPDALCRTSGTTVYGQGTSGKSRGGGTVGAPS